MLRRQALIQDPPDTLNITANHRLDESVDDCCAGAFVFAPQRRDLVGERDMGLGQGCANCLRGTIFVLSIKVSEEAADGHSHLLANQRRGLSAERLEILGIKHGDFAPVIVQPGADAEAMAALHQGLRLSPMEIVDALLVHAADEGHVLEASIGDVEDGRSAPL
jgi:hypothetical protein